MRKALTLAELLVTMTIVGAVATLVLPGFLKDYHNKIYVTKLKKFYENVDQAINQACLDYNVSSLRYTPYGLMKTNSETGNLYQQDFLDKYFKKSSSQTTNPFSKKYKAINSDTLNIYALSETMHGWAKLASGEAVSYWCPSKIDSSAANHYCLFRVDVNGTDGPNVGGRDLFQIYVNFDTNELYDKEASSNNCYKVFDYAGKGCFGRILKDNWEMKY